MRVFDKMHQQMPTLKLYVVGMKPCNEKLFTFAELSSFDNVIFTGQVSSNDLKNMLNRASLMLITSYQEGLGIVGLEAMLHGTPVIATDCGGPRDYVIDDVTGYLVAINDDQAMAEKALGVLKSPELHHKLSINARRLIEEQFSTAKIYKQFKDGLSTTYPLLQKWFNDADAERMALHGYERAKPLQEAQ